MDLSEFPVDVAKELTRRRIEQADRRRNFMQWTDKERDADVAAAWADLEAAHPLIPKEEVKPEPKPLERQQIEKIGFWIWDMFHTRHGGEFNPDATDSPAVTMTMAAADRAWAIAQVKPESSTSDITNIMIYTSKLAAAGDWMWIDIMLEGLEVTRMSSTEIATYARCCWAMREHLDCYDDYLDRCRAALTRRGDDHKRLLQGLESATKSS